jgi:hypothetical protein
MDINEFVSTFLGRIKDMKDKLGDIGEKVSNIDLGTIFLNGMLEDYQMFITGLAAGEKSPTFEELIGILLQKEDMHTNLKPQNSDLAVGQRRDSLNKNQKKEEEEEIHFKESHFQSQIKVCHIIEMNLSVSIVVGLGILPKNVIRRKIMRLGPKIEKIHDILQKKTQILIQNILDYLCLMLHCLLKLMMLMHGLWILELQFT